MSHAVELCALYTLVCDLCVCVSPQSTKLPITVLPSQPAAENTLNTQCHLFLDAAAAEVLTIMMMMNDMHHRQLYPPYEMIENYFIVIIIITSDRLRDHVSSYGRNF